MRGHRIAVIGGDGIGPEVTEVACRVLRAVADAVPADLLLEPLPWGAGYYLETGEPMPEGAADLLRGYDAVLFGAHGDPRVPAYVTGQGMLHRLRRELGLAVNIRPAHTLPGVESPLKARARIDLVVVRENTEELYNGSGVRLHAGTAYDTGAQQLVVTRGASERVARHAFALARSRRRRLTCVSKGSALGVPLGVWTDAVHAVAADYPDVETTVENVDAMAMHLVLRPADFDVILATNLMGDILSDLAAAVAGGIGVAPSASVDPSRQAPGLFEPVHGSAPDLAGRDVANPVAAVRAAALLLDWLGLAEPAAAVEHGVRAVLADPATRTADVGGRATLSGCADAIVEQVRGALRRA